MCLQIATHTQVCDTRPTIKISQDSDSTVVDPFRAPDVLCSCEKGSDARGSQQDCGTITTRLVQCPCDNVVQYHTYVLSPSGSVESPVWREEVYTMEEHYGVHRSLGSTPISEELRAARCGVRFHRSQLEARELDAKQAFRELRSAREECQVARLRHEDTQIVQLAEHKAKFCEKVREAVCKKASELSKCAQNWEALVELLEKQELGKTGAVEMP
ncbi:hypothetical protein BKA67DRAFT_539717 [Truncatella angustata]|uniref:Uncharacterized protein n=1 Tax=Truncatella angustata TaxID=152316 RepID=A0A9P8UDG4_9PEZI|nr:uncharacterized protein BKA67DRAFT_539717 [Truncatella angustata]KAH6647887.1 hypothetical protein BKA67DRAFT_539717 [Truncatella angustata]